MKFVLILIALTSNGHETKWAGDFANMEECFENRDKVIDLVGRPIVNYQAVCVISDNPK